MAIKSKQVPMRDLMLWKTRRSNLACGIVVRCLVIELIWKGEYSMIAGSIGQIVGCNVFEQGVVMSKDWHSARITPVSSNTVEA